jgi:flagellar basal-body rod protein FlgF
MLEGSNVEPIIEMTRMIRVQRAYDSARMLIDKEDERIKRMVQVYSG